MHVHTDYITLAYIVSRGHNPFCKRVRGSVWYCRLLHKNLIYSHFVSNSSSYVREYCALIGPILCRAERLPGVRNGVWLRETTRRKGRLVHCTYDMFSNTHSNWEMLQHQWLYTEASETNMLYSLLWQALKHYWRHHVNPHMQKEIKMWEVWRVFSGRLCMVTFLFVLTSQNFVDPDERTSAV